MFCYQKTLCQTATYAYRIKLANKRGERVTNRKRVLFTEIQPGLSYTTTSNRERVANEKLVLFTDIQTLRELVIPTATYCYLLKPACSKRGKRSAGYALSVLLRI